jgi:acetyl esterase/lipase
MKSVLLLLLGLTLSTLAQSQTTPPDPKQLAREIAEKNEIELRLDQPYAGTTHPKQAVDVYLPKQRKSDQPLPVLALIHGGAWARLDRIDLARLATQLASTGDYGVVTIGYRLTGEAPWPAQIHDCKAAIRWIRANARGLKTDPDKIAVWGSSAGGHLASLLGTSGDVAELEGDFGPHKGVSSRVQAVVNLCGPEDLRLPLVFDSEGRPDWNDDAIIGLFSGPAPERQAEARAASPVTYVTRDDPPFITFHGTADERVAYGHAETLHGALQEAGVSSLLVPIIGGAHRSVGHAEVKVRAQVFLNQVFQGQPLDVDTSPIPVPPARENRRAGQNAVLPLIRD